MTFEFASNEKVVWKNMFVTNCAEKVALFFSNKLGTMQNLDLLRGNRIVSLKVLTKTDPVKIKFSEVDAARISKSLDCLANYIGIQPPDTIPMPGGHVNNPSGKFRDSTTDESKVFVVVEQQPEFEGGYAELRNFLQKNLKIPKSAIKDGIKGSVFVSFLIGKDGHVQDVKVVDGVREDLDAAAIKVVQSMPPWRPGYQNGKPVVVRFQVQVKFDY
jgi:TonB family protein